MPGDVTPGAIGRPAAPGQTPFEKAQDNVADAVVEGFIQWQAAFLNTGHEVRTFHNTDNEGAVGTIGMGDDNPNNLAWDGTTRLEIVMWMKVAGFPNLDANTLAGVGAHESVSVGLWDGAVASVGDWRLLLGVDANGDLQLLTDDRSATTVTDTGVDYVDDTWIHVYLRFDHGSEAAVAIDGGAETTHATNLPDGLFEANMGKPANAAGNIQAFACAPMFRLTRTGL